MALHSFSNDTISGWQSVQDSLSAMTGLELCVYDEAGCLGSVSGRCPFCEEASSEGALSRCSGQCAGFIRETLDSGSREPRFFNCWLGLRVFALRLKVPGEGLVLSGGKTFESRPEYNAVIEKLKNMGVRVHNTGRHKYRFAGKHRLNELVEHVAGVADQYFNISNSLSSYRLKLNRQAALIENASLLYQVDDIGALLEGFMRALESLFGFDCLSMHLYAIGDEEKDWHMVRGAPVERVFKNPGLFADWLRRNHKPGGEPVLTEDRQLLATIGAAPGVNSVTAMPVVISGELLGFVCIINSGLSAEDMEPFRAYVQQMATAIDNRRLRTGVLDKLKRLKAMSVLYSSAGTMQDPDEIYRLLLEKSTELLRAERGSLMLINEKTDELFIKSSKGIAQDVLGSTNKRRGEGIAGMVASSGSPIVVRDVELEPRPGVSRRPDYKTGSFVSVPLKVRGRVVGVVNLTDKEGGGSFDYDDLEFMLGLASHAGTALESTLYEERKDELDNLVVCDELTGLLKWHYFNARLADEAERSRRYGRSFSFMLLDIDGFDAYRDENGAKAVEMTLRRLSSLLLSSLRAMDIVSWYSEGRLAVALPETSLANTVAIANRIRRRVEAARFPDGELVDSRRLTVSVGLSEYPADSAEPRGLFDAAVSAMESARNKGSNTVVSFSQKDS